MTVATSARFGSLTGLAGRPHPRRHRRRHRLRRPGAGAHPGAPPGRHADGRHVVGRLERAAPAAGAQPHLERHRHAARRRSARRGGRHRLSGAARGRVGRARADAARARRAGDRSVGRLPHPRRRRSAEVVSRHRGAARRHRVRDDRRAPGVDQGRAPGLQSRLLSDRGGAGAGAARQGGAARRQRGGGRQVGPLGRGQGGRPIARTSPRTTAAWRRTASSRTGTWPRWSRSWACRSRSCRTSCRSTAASSRRSTRRSSPGSPPRRSRTRSKAAHGDAPFVRLTGARSAGDQARRAHEFLRHRLEGGRGAASRGAGGGDRQPGEGRGRLGGAEPERPARSRRADRPAVVARREKRAGRESCLKLGGELLERPEDVQRIARGIRTLAAQASLTVVHGGGKEIDAALALAGIPKRQVDGLRVTDAPTLDVVVAVLAGSINTRLVAAVRRGGRSAGRPDRRRRRRRGGETRRADHEHRRRARGPRPGGHAGRRMATRRCWWT